MMLPQDQDESLQGLPPTPENIERAKAELQRVLEEEKQLVGKQMELLVQAQDLRTAVAKLELEKQLEELTAQRTHADQLLEERR